MNPLVALKRKLMVKPDAGKKRQRVEIVIQGAQVSDKAEPIIVDETHLGFDREALMRKLAERGTMTTPIVQPAATPLTLVVPTATRNKPQKVKPGKRVFVIEEEEEDEAKDEKAKEEKAKRVVGEEERGEKREEEGEKREGEKREGEKREEERQDISGNIVPVTAPKKRQRLTQKPAKGVAIIGPESRVIISEQDLKTRMPAKLPSVIIKVSSYYMNNREIFINFINSLFEPYRKEFIEHQENVTCESIGQTSSNFSLLTHQKIVRDYMNLYTPYRGLFINHGLGSGKTCTSIAMAEGLKDTSRIIIMTPASLRANYVEELKKCGDLLYKRNQYWEWISTIGNAELATTIAGLLNLPQEYIQKKNGAFFVNINKPSNYDQLSDVDREKLEDQLNEMIRQKYTFIHYNGLRAKRLYELTSGYKKNIFDNAVVIIDEAHNLISRIVNQIKKEKPPSNEEPRRKKVGAMAAAEGATAAAAAAVEDDGSNIFGDTTGKNTPKFLATKLYYMLLRATNCRIIPLSGTPVINYINEFGILYNIVRGYIKTWKIPLIVRTNNKIDKQAIYTMLVGEKSFDYLDYSSSSKILTITRNPFGFKNKIKKDSGYVGVSNNTRDDKTGELVINNDTLSDDDFERRIINLLKKNDIDVVYDGIQVINMKALPDDLGGFVARYVNESDKTLKNVDALKRRIIGLTSYFKSAYENLLPKYSKQLGVDYHIVRIPMSDVQFKIYESARKSERKLEKKKPKAGGMDELFEEKSSTYRIFSRLYCNYVILDRPIPEYEKKKGEEGEGAAAAAAAAEGEEGEGAAAATAAVAVAVAATTEGKEAAKGDLQIAHISKEGNKLEKKQDVEDEREGEIEGDEILDAIGGKTYKERLENAILHIKEKSNDFLTPEALRTYSPKFLHMLDNIKDPEYLGLHLVYSQFRTAEGIGLFSLVLEKNGFARFRIEKNTSTSNEWKINIHDIDHGKPMYALYTGTESAEEKEIIRHIYNGEWDQIPESISSVLRAKYRNNNMGEVIKVFMITSSGSEGINLKNTRYVHIMEPYWHPVRLEQVIGRARRICSHKDLPLALQTVEVFVYIMIFSEEQLKSDDAIELKRNDLSKSLPPAPITSDQYLFEISEIKANLNAQLTDVIKESAFDCYIYSKDGKCVSFGNPSNDKFAYVPDYAEQQNDSTAQANKVAKKWTGKEITINGVKYIYHRTSDTVMDLYDMQSYLNAMENTAVVPQKLGTYEINQRGETVLKLLVT